MKNDLITIREAAALLGVSVDTLRRWDKNGKLVAIRKEGGTHRYYTRRDLELVQSNLYKMASEWAFAGGDISSELYCPNSAVFQHLLMVMSNELERSGLEGTLLPLIVAITGEIGNNSYDHNLGNWPDQPGAFYGYKVNEREIVLADRGLGILHTLKKVKPELSNHREALRSAFTEIISGRYPEARGNGLKFVRSIIGKYPINLFFQSGDAELRMQAKNLDLHITRSPVMIRGCLARITY